MHPWIKKKSFPITNKGTFDNFHWKSFEIKRKKKRIRLTEFNETLENKKKLILQIFIFFITIVNVFAMTTDSV